MSVRTAAEIVRPLLNQARALVQLSDALDQIGVIENHRDELKNEVASLQNTVDGMKRDVKDIEDWMERETEKTKQACATLTKVAKAESDKIIAEAARESTRRLNLATEEVEKVKAEKTLLDKQMLVVFDRVKELTDERDSLAAEIEKFRDRVAQVCE